MPDFETICFQIRELENKKAKLINFSNLYVSEDIGEWMGLAIIASGESFEGDQWEKGYVQIGERARRLFTNQVGEWIRFLTPADWQSLLVLLRSEESFYGADRILQLIDIGIKKNINDFVLACQKATPTPKVNLAGYLRMVITIACTRVYSYDRTHDPVIFPSMIERHWTCCRYCSDAVNRILPPKE